MRQPRSTRGRRFRHHVYRSPGNSRNYWSLDAKWIFLFVEHCVLVSACSSRPPENDFGLVWKVEGYDDRYPEDYDLDLFNRVGVYGVLVENNIHDNYIGACELCSGVVWLVRMLSGRGVAVLS